MKNDDSEEALDPDVGEYLPAKDFEDSSNQKYTEALLDTIEDFEIYIPKAIPKSSNHKSKELSTVIINGENGDSATIDFPDKKVNNNHAKKGSEKSIYKNNTRDVKGDIPAKHCKKISAEIPILNIRNLVRNKNTGEYTIIFTPDSSAEDGILKIFMSAESQSYEASIIASSCSKCPKLKFQKNKIFNLIFTEKKAIRINIQFTDAFTFLTSSFGIAGGGDE